MRNQANHHKTQFSFFLGLILILYLCMSGGCNSQSAVNLGNSSEEANQNIGFDLSTYDDYGKWSDGLAWAMADNWNDEMDEYQKEFAYFDTNGNQVSEWFSNSVYEPSNFSNHFVIIGERSGSGKQYRPSVLQKIYDTEFNLIAEIRTGSGLKEIRDFDENGFSFAYGIVKEYDTNKELYWIDRNGAHAFSEHVYASDVTSDITVTDKYFIIDNKYISDHSGNVLLNLKSILENDTDFSNKYQFSGSFYNEKGMLVTDDKYTNQFEIIEISDGKSIEFKFNALNRTSHNEIWFSCVVDFNGKIQEGPTKII